MTDDEKITFSFTFSLDRDNFFRRTCPSCGRDFKTEVEPNDLAAIIQTMFSAN